MQYLEPTTLRQCGLAPRTIQQHSSPNDNSTHAQATTAHQPKAQTPYKPHKHPHKRPHLHSSPHVISPPALRTPTPTLDPPIQRPERIPSSRPLLFLLERFRRRSRCGPHSRRRSGRGNARLLSRSRTLGRECLSLWAGSSLLAPDASAALARKSRAPQQIAAHLFIRPHGAATRLFRPQGGGGQHHGRRVGRGALPVLLLQHQAG